MDKTESLQQIRKSGAMQSAIADLLVEVERRNPGALAADADDLAYADSTGVFVSLGALRKLLYSAA